LIYNSEKEEIKFEYSNNILSFEQQIFEFKSTSKQDRFEIVLLGVKDNDDNQIIEIGKKLFPLEEISSQEEYTVQITIPEKDNKDKEAALINSKITLNWSDYKYYEEKKKNSENKLRKLNDALLKVNKYLIELKDIYGSPLNNYNTEATRATKGHSSAYDTNMHINESFSEKNINNYIQENQLQDQSLKVNNTLENNNIYDNNNQFGVGYEEAKSEYDDRININTKNSSRNSYKNLKAVWFIKLLSLLSILFALFNSLQRPDYPSALIGIICFWYIFFVDKKNLAIKSKNFWNLFLLVFAGLIYDCFWLYICFDFLGPMTIEGSSYDNAIKRLSYLTSGCGTIIKCCLAILMFQHYRMNY